MKNMNVKKENKYEYKRWGKKRSKGR